MQEQYEAVAEHRRKILEKPQPRIAPPEGFAAQVGICIPSLSL